jgi:hypothetical protein
MREVFDCVHEHAEGPCHFHRSEDGQRAQPYVEGPHPRRGQEVATEQTHGGSLRRVHPKSLEIHIVSTTKK